MKKRKYKKLKCETNVKKRSELLHQKMMAKFQAAKFRIINEDMTINNIKPNIKKNDLVEYHEAFKKVQENWPEKPINKICDILKKRSKHKIIADMGCGEAFLSQSLPNKVYSFDLESFNPNVIVCDMSKTPLKNSNCDVVVFCLSLMGNSIGLYLKEAYRILKMNGLLIIAELANRFNSFNQFIKKMEMIGFILESKDITNTCFWLLIFKKQDSKRTNINIKLKSFKYKKR